MTGMTGNAFLFPDFKVHVKFEKKISMWNRIKKYLKNVKKTYWKYQSRDIQDSERVTIGKNISGLKRPDVLVLKVAKIIWSPVQSGHFERHVEK